MLGGGKEPITILREINLTVPRGEFVAVVGPSGSGKSTLLNLLGGLDQPSRGRVVVDGIDLGTLHGNGLADFRRQRVGFVFQLFNLVPVLTTVENVKLPLIPYPPRQFSLEERAQELLTLVGLGQRLHHLPGQLSGGEQQRVAVARALLNQPALLLADEPTGNLDRKTGTALLELFGRLHQQQHLTLVLVTHDPAIAARAERVLELRDGILSE